MLVHPSHPMANWFKGSAFRLCIFGRQGGQLHLHSTLPGVCHWLLDSAFIRQYMSCLKCDFLWPQEDLGRLRRYMLYAADLINIVCSPGKINQPFCNSLFTQLNCKKLAWASSLFFILPSQNKSTAIFIRIAATMKCPKCYHNNPTYKNNCESCGAELPKNMKDG